MRKIKHLEVPDEVWEDKRIPYETKYVYSFILAKGFDRTITHLDIGEMQQDLKIKNKGLKKSLDILENLNYLIYKDHTHGRYTITLN